jgi:hypothetical protein
LDKFSLDYLQAFVPLAVSDLSLRAAPALEPMLLVQFLNLSNLHSETPNLFPKNFEVIHTIRLAYLHSLSAVAKLVRKVGFFSPPLNCGKPERSILGS